MHPVHIELNLFFFFFFLESFEDNNWPSELIVFEINFYESRHEENMG